ncbi:hypothetical protein ACSBR1_018225 [Camellia fascicularis]
MENNSNGEFVYLLYVIVYVYSFKDNNNITLILTCCFLSPILAADATSSLLQYPTHWISIYYSCCHLVHVVELMIDLSVVDPYGGLFDDEETRTLNIKERLEDPDQSEDSLVELLQSVADMDMTFKALKETDIGRHVNRLWKNPSNDVWRLVKQLIRKWKDLVDE